MKFNIFGIVLLTLLWPLLPTDLHAQRPARECDEKCLAKRYKERTRRAARQETWSVKRTTRDLLKDVKKNPDFSDTTRAILVEQIEDGFAEFSIPNATNADPAVIPPIKSLSLREFWAHGPADFYEKVECKVSPCTSPYDFDVPGNSVFLLYNLITLSVDEMVKYINQEEEQFLRVYLNGNLLTQETDFKMYPGGDCGKAPFSGCITLLIPGHVWYPSTPPWPVWEVTIEFWHVRDGLEFECPAKVAPPQSLRSFWLATIGQSVISERCTACHTMDTVQEIQDRHAASSIFVNPVLIPSLLVPGESVYHCQNCHEDALPYLGPTSPFPEKIWATPTEALDINWAELVQDNPSTWPSVVCQRMLANLPTPELREQHFHEDSRLFWAVAKGELPPPATGTTLPTAFPSNYDRFIENFDTWNDAGARCP